MTANKWVKIGLNVSFIFSLIPTVLIILFTGKLPLEIPLYYSLPWGQAQIAQTSSLAILPTSSFILLVINFILYRTFKDSLLMSLIFVWTSATFSFLAFFALIRIILLVL